MPGVGVVVRRAATEHLDVRRVSGVRHVWLGWIPARAATSRPACHFSRGASAGRARSKSVSCAAYLMALRRTNGRRPNRKPPSRPTSSSLRRAVAWSARGGSDSRIRRTTAKAFAKDVFINQERKLGARRRSDTVLVSTINDADQGSADVAFRTPPAPYEKSKFLGSGGSMVARLKLKGIDGRAPPGVEPAA
ncbi:hypothetical protein RND71_026597 [Anisodus tanguticus]|uniref:rRNA intron-encoded homing endonuclease n=1 Tax=Anisodus tanguticus TaxID=243964 RepID=A0AAE1RMI0_9SOLA|nr:hypothetical protein RND71_026597 [Anisodus tanguticus]